MFFEPEFAAFRIAWSFRAFRRDDWSAAPGNPPTLSRGPKDVERPPDISVIIPTQHKIIE